MKARFQLIAKFIAQNQGMSLIEILVALTLLAGAGTFIAIQVNEQFEEGKYKSTQININNLKQVLNEYRRHCGRFPTTEQGLEALITKPTVGPECTRYSPTGYIQDGQVPQDAWEKDFIYTSDGQTFRIVSYGADEQEGGEGFNADIDSSKPANKAGSKSEE